MRRPTLICIAGTALLALTGCGGSRNPTQPTPLPPATASKAVGAFLLIESSPSTPAALPSWMASPGGGALQFAPGVLAQGCVGTETTPNPDGSTTLKATFACSSQTDGSTLSGAIWFTFSLAAPGEYLLEYRDLKLVQETRSWTVNGTKRVALDLALTRAALSTPTPMTMSFLDTTEPGNSRTYSYVCNLVSNWATPGSTKVWGTFSLQSGNAPTLAGSIPEFRPLTWAAGCCYPTSGTLTLSQGAARSDVNFVLPCGGYSISGIYTLLPLTLPACPN